MTVNSALTEVAADIWYTQARSHTAVLLRPSDSSIIKISATMRQGDGAELKVTFHREDASKMIALIEMQSWWEAIGAVQLMANRIGRCQDRGDNWTDAVQYVLEEREEL